MMSDTIHNSSGTATIFTIMRYSIGHPSARVIRPVMLPGGGYFKGHSHPKTAKA
jgi:hypothetical protein